MPSIKFSHNNQWQLVVEIHNYLDFSMQNYTIVVTIDKHYFHLTGI
jgi:hypothetical protein